VSKDSGKTWKVESVESALGYGAFFEDEISPGDLDDALLAAIAAWGDLSGDAERAMPACLRYVNHADSRIRAATVSAIGKLVSELTESPAMAIAAISRALSDSSLQVRESAESAAHLVYEQLGITITAAPR
jgi:HEAT repeat protein